MVCFIRCLSLSPNSERLGKWTRFYRCMSIPVGFFSIQKKFKNVIKSQIFVCGGRIRNALGSWEENPFFAIKVSLFGFPHAMVEIKSKSLWNAETLAIVSSPQIKMGTGRFRRKQYQQPSVNNTKTKTFPHRESNPGRLGESQES